MTKLLVFIVPFLFCGAAEAARIGCSGASMGYSVQVFANVSGSHIVGNIVATVSGGMSGRQTVALQTVSSAIKPGSYIQFSGQGSSFSGSVLARFDRSSQLYYGTMSVQAAGTSGSGNVTCRLTGLGKGKFGLFESDEEVDESETAVE